MFFNLYTDRTLILRDFYSPNLVAESDVAEKEKRRENKTDVKRLYFYAFIKKLNICSMTSFIALMDNL